MSSFDRPREIIEFCLKPLNLDTGTEAYVDAYRRLEHVIKTYQIEIVKQNKPVAVDFSKMPSVVINEDAHGLND